VARPRPALYIGGFFLLPWLWLVCYMYFYPVLGRESLDPRVRSCTAAPGRAGPRRAASGAALGRVLTEWPFVRPVPRTAADCRRSLLLGLFCFVPLIIWFTVFQLEYGFWGSVGEALLVAVPRGYYGRSS